MNINIMQSKLAKVGSKLRESPKMTEYYFYLIRCIVCFAIGKRPPMGYEECTKVHNYQGITSLDVFANYQAFSTHKSNDESTLEKLAVVAAFGSGIFLICFSVFLFF